VNVLVAEIGSEIDLRVLGTDAIVAATLTADGGPVEITVPRDREGSFEPQIVRKRQRRL
jgi:hypothetical protein